MTEKIVKFQDLAAELNQLPEGEREAFAAFLYDTNPDTARAFMRELGFADMDAVYRVNQPE